MRNFVLRRYQDPTGVSGIGVVAEGCEFTNGKAVLAWLTQYTSVAVYESADELQRIHGHEGRTVLEWLE